MLFIKAVDSYLIHNGGIITFRPPLCLVHCKVKILPITVEKAEISIGAVGHLDKIVADAFRANPIYSFKVVRIVYCNIIQRNIRCTDALEIERVIEFLRPSDKLVIRCISAYINRDRITARDPLIVRHRHTIPGEHKSRVNRQSGICIIDITDRPIVGIHDIIIKLAIIVHGVP